LCLQEAEKEAMLIENPKMGADRPESTLILLSGIYFAWPFRKDGGLFKRRNTGATTRNARGYGKNSFRVFEAQKEF
jgi:hypothetical protein